MEEKSLDFGKVWLIFVRRKWLFIFPVAIFTVLGVLIALGLPKIYGAKCVLLVEQSKVIEGIFEERGGPSNVNKASMLVKTVSEMMLGWAPVTSVLKEVGLLSEKDLDRSGSEVEELYKDVIDRVRFSTKGDNLIEVSFQDKQPFLAYRVMDSMLSHFIERFLGMARSQVDSTLAFIDKDLKRLRDKLDESEEKLREFEERNSSQLPEAEMNNMVKLHTQRDNLSKIELEIAIQREKLSVIDENLKKEDSTILGEIIKIPNPKAAEINKRIDELETSLAAMHAKYYDTHPAIAMAKKEIASLKNKLKEEEEKVVGAEKTINNPIYEQIVAKRYEEEMKLKALEMQRKALQVPIAELEESVRAMPAVKKELTELRRNYDVLRGLYNERLAQKSKEELRREMSMYAMASPFTIIEPPRIPKEPIKSTRIKVFLIALFLGLALGVGLVFITEQLDQRFKGVEDAKAFLQIPLLGVVPAIRLAEDLLMERRKKRRNIIIIGAATLAFGVIIGLVILLAPELVHKSLDTIQKKVG
jgi:polysaccharide chain length determinant protein (PEP-CTERM system associated)